MKGVDKDRVNRVVYEMSKDSSYFKNAKRHDDRVERCATHRMRFICLRLQVIVFVNAAIAHACVCVPPTGR